MYLAVTTIRVQPPGFFVCRAEVLEGASALRYSISGPSW
jgi:hypothetical protein